MMKCAQLDRVLKCWNSDNPLMIALDNLAKDLNQWNREAIRDRNITFFWTDSWAIGELLNEVAISLVPSNVHTLKVRFGRHAPYFEEVSTGEHAMENIIGPWAEMCGKRKGPQVVVLVDYGKCQVQRKARLLEYQVCNHFMVLVETAMHILLGFHRVLT
ncbi:hypothetical protein Cgig2_023352 [Carnegiea gigantea]|uniref:Uncharacterized protein n=1 Tax=Carnegiea gigantea TaxID=171969 RepID=A0A9Q1H045_9CARY|nr:hypothetical protein Cgig2_023352 [Carnegiea gigantea]